MRWQPLLHVLERSIREDVKEDSSVPTMGAARVLRLDCADRLQEASMSCPDRAQPGASVQHWRKGAVAHIHFNRPQALNAIDSMAKKMPR